MRTNVLRAATGVTQTLGVATRSARTSASVTRASLETDTLVLVGNGEYVNDFLQQHTSRKHYARLTQRGSESQQLLQTCLCFQTLMSATSTTVTVNTAAQTSQEGTGASVPPGTSWTQVNTTAQVRQGIGRISLNLDKTGI